MYVIHEQIIYHPFISAFLILAAAVSGQSHRDYTSSQSPAVTQQKSSIPSQELKAPPTPVCPKSEQSPPIPAGDHKSMSSNTTIDSTHYSMTGIIIHYMYMVLLYQVIVSLHYHLYIQVTH